MWGLGVESSAQVCGLIGLGLGSAWVRVWGLEVASWVRQGTPTSFGPLYIACAPRRITRRVLKSRAVSIGTLLNSRTTTSHKYEAVPKRARVEGS